MMKNDIEKAYLIDRFLKGELSGPALDEFRNKLRNDKQFAEEVQMQRAIIEGIKMARRQHLISILNGNKIAETPANLKPVKNEQSVDENNNEITLPPHETFGEKNSNGREYSLRPNYNNWYYAAVAVLFAALAYYGIFEYYIPHQRLVTNNTDTSQTDKPIKDIQPVSENTPVIAESPVIKDTVPETSPIIAQVDTVKVEKDRKISESIYSVSAFESTSPTDEKDDGKVSVKDTNGLKLSPVRKVRGSTIKVEYWQSVINFKGYKLSGGNLQLYDVNPNETISLKYLDKQLYMKRNGNYYLLNASGDFEKYKKETDTKIITKLESN